MASPAPGEQTLSAQVGQKRKRETNDHDARIGERQFSDAIGDDADFLNPDDDDHNTDNENDDDNGYPTLQTTRMRQTKNPTTLTSALRVSAKRMLLLTMNHMSHSQLA